MIIETKITMSMALVIVMKQLDYTTTTKASLLLVIWLKLLRAESSKAKQNELSVSLLIASMVCTGVVMAMLIIWFLMMEQKLQNTIANWCKITKHYLNQLQAKNVDGIWKNISATREGNSMEIIIKVNEASTIKITGQKALDFKEWLDYECNGAEPTEDLWEEFCWLENIFRPKLIKTLGGLL